MTSYIKILTQTRGAIEISVHRVVGATAVLGVAGFGIAATLAAINSMAGA